MARFRHEGDDFDAGRAVAPGLSRNRRVEHDRPRAVVNVDKGYALLVVTNAATLGSINPGMNAVNDATAMLEKYHTGCPDYSGSIWRGLTFGR